MLGLCDKVSSTNELKEGTRWRRKLGKAEEKQNISFLPLTITGSSSILQINKHRLSSAEVEIY